MDGYDLIIVGAGPAGQSLAARLAQAPLRIALIDSQPQAALATPSDDGREIALTQTSIARPQQLGAWDHLARTAGLHLMNMTPGARRLVEASLRH